MDKRLRLLCLLCIGVSTTAAAHAATADSRTESSETAVPRSQSAYRNWTDASGRTINARVESVDANAVHLVLRSGKKGAVSIARLSAQDRMYVGRLRTSQVAQINQSRPNDAMNGANPRISRDTAETVGLPRSKNAIASLKKRRVRQERTQEYQVVRYEIEYYWQYYRKHRRWCRRLCVRKRPVMETRTRSITVEVQVLRDPSLFDDATDPRVGEYTASINLESLPSAAGGRASRISTVMQRQLPSNIVETTEDVDRTLAIESIDFSPQGAPAGKERKFRVVALVDEGSADRTVRLTVLVLQRGVDDQILESDKAILNRIAQGIADIAVSELKE